ncbi:MAG: glucokinase [Anaerolineales bacterium]|nr:glucokinase [Anaerolineales bacterium]MCB8992108.1 glucokinase [Ardenticatenaceae bacterium]
MILAGDIGGTKTVLALISHDAGVQRPFREATFPSSHYTSLAEIIREFLADVPETPTAASFGVAGPVVNGRAVITNLPWVIDAEAISSAFHIPRVNLLNDLEAIATAVPHLTADELATLNTGQPNPTGAIAIVAPGTGLGEAFLVWDGSRYRAYPTEGGHVSFAPANQEELDLLVYLQRKFGHVSYERICSGSGIPNIFDFLSDGRHYKNPGWLRRELAMAEDRTPIIFHAALEKQEPIAIATLELFVKILGGEVGNMALKVLATGGIYIGGGIPPRILPLLQRPEFLSFIAHKGRFSELLSRIPVHVIQNPKAALHGAAYDGLEEFA